MTREDIIRMAQEAGIVVTGEAVWRLCEIVAAAERNKVAQWMIDRSYATGHGDTVEDLLNELESQVIQEEREICAQVCEAKIVSEYATGKVDHMAWTQACAFAIRARGEK